MASQSSGVVARVVVAYDGSPDADAALVWACESAYPRQHQIEVVIVGSDLDPVIGHFRETEDRAVEELWTAAGDRLKELGVEGHVQVRRGPVVPQLIRASTGATMLVVGSSGHNLAGGTVTGSVSQHVARHASCPVVAVRPLRSPHARRIVVGIDGSAESAKALRFACERAQVTGDPVVAVHGFHSLSMRWLPLDTAASEGILRRMAEADRFVSEQIAGCATDFPDVEIAAEAAPVRPAELLVDCSAAASLVVVGSRGRDAFAELLLGSVSQHVLQHAHCPVAIVR